ncbi:hypothetical protein [Estrella lausannensis]|uniref:Putative secreted protein n=1 Tax=Estrella lausannensis TaxID=483423 RepID=A0A0H5DN48_9BACT|nr:hypothetical protein [Estrella lausannensis]CRX37507.1 Putative secreted protein [Estrella lausannensis]
MYPKIKKLALSVFCLFLMSAGHERLAGESYVPVQTFTAVIPGSPTLGDGFGNTVTLHEDKDWLFVTESVAEPEGTVIPGAVYYYKKKGSQFENKQILETGGIGDHLGLLDLQTHGKWLFVSAPGTPLGNTDPSQADFTGALLIYHLEDGEWKLRQTLDRNTPGLEDLTPANPASLNPVIPAQIFQQGASFGFNFSVDLAHGLLLVAAQYQQNLDAENQPLMNSGAVYAFHLSSSKGEWELFQKITNPAGSVANDAFGAQVALYEDMALISNGVVAQTPRLEFTAVSLPVPVPPLPSSPNSSVFLYHFHDKEWHHLQTVSGDQQTGTAITLGPFFSPFITGPVSIGDGFGCALALNKYWAVIGACFEAAAPNGSTTLSGAAYFYSISGSGKDASLVRQQKVFSDDPTTQGTSLINISLRKDTVLISDPLHVGPEGQVNQGAILVYKFHKDRWEHKDTLFDPSGAAKDFFGFGIAQNGDYVAGGTGSFTAAVTFLNVGLPLVVTPFPLNNGKVVLYKRK